MCSDVLTQRRLRARVRVGLRELTRRWRLWHVRCALDIAISQRGKPKSFERLGVKAGWQDGLVQVFARCNFCSQSLVTGGPQQPVKASRPTRASRSFTKPSACPQCKKPLPRCALCMQHLGCPDTGELAAQQLPSLTPVAPTAEAGDTWEAVSSAYGHWMVWCQTCRHGGHAAHLEEWFAAHDECPVSGCTCRCATNDRRSLSS
ncbi:MAG: hypothetical protein SGPRY_008602 [Prymnesium sp.]